MAPKGAASAAAQRQQAWVSLARILREVFDVPAVLRGRKPASALIGVPHVLGSLAVAVIQMWSRVASMEVSQQVVEAIYLRDMRAFAAVMAKNTALQFITMGMYSFTHMWAQQQASHWQEHLSKLFHERYFQAITFYRQQNLPDDVKLVDPEDRIVTDIRRACTTISDCMQSVFSSVLSTGYVVWRLARNSHPSYVGVVMIYAFGGIKIREFISPGVRHGRLAGRIAKISGEYRSAHKALLEHGEAIVASGGVGREGKRVQEKYNAFIGVWWDLVREDSRSTFAMSFQMQVQMTLMNIMQHFPFLRGDHPLRASPGASEQERFKANAAMLGSMRFTMSLVSDAMMRMGMLARQPRTIMMISGTCNRVAALLDAVDPTNFAVQSTDGKVTTGGSHITFEKVDIDTPKGLRLVSNLSFSVSPGGDDNLLIVGENGVGKTSIFRTLQTLWPAASGTIKKPDLDETIILAQTPYIATGLSLEEQLAYPKVVKVSRSTAELSQLLQMVDLDPNLLQQDAEAAAQGTIVDWDTTLSFGQKQKLACAKLFFHKPRFAVLDEATRGLGPAFERSLFENCAAFGITVLTVAHAPTLLQFHRRILHVHSDRWSLEAVQEATKSSLIRTQSAAIANTEADAKKEKANEATKLAEARQHEDLRSDPYETNLKNRIQALPKVSMVQRLKMMGRILLPQVTVADKGIKLILATVGLLVCTTWANGRLITQFPGQLQAMAMQADASGYVKLTMLSTGASLVMTFMDMVSSWINSSLAIHWTSQLTSDVMKRYVQGGAFYTINQLDKRVADADTRITRELVDACDRLASLLKGGGGMTYGGGPSGKILQTQQRMGGSSGLIRPLVDTVYCTVLLIQVRLPMNALIAMWLYGLVGIGAVKFFSPDYSQFTAETERVEGEFRTSHAKVKMNAEAIAFLNGGAIERSIVERKMGNMLNVARWQLWKRGVWGPVNNFIMWGSPYIVTDVLRMMWSRDKQHGTTTDIMSNSAGTAISSTGMYIESLIMRSFRTFSSLLGLHEELASLFGVVGRVTDLMLVLDDIRAPGAGSPQPDAQLEVARLASNIGGAFSPRGSRTANQRDSGIRVAGCDLVTPSGRCMAKQLCFTLSQHAGHLAVLGPSGCGKSSLFKVLGKRSNLI